MIAKQIKGKDFYGVLAYNQKKIDNGYGKVIDSNISKGSVIKQTKEFNLVRQLRPNLSKAVYHTSLNLPYKDNLSDNQFANLAQDYLYGMGFNDNQFIVYLHTDQEHSHIHIVANRVKFSGKVVSDSNDYKRSERLIRKLENKYNLSPLNRVEETNTLSQGEIESCLRTANIPDRIELQYTILNILSQNVRLQIFIQKLKEKKITPIFNISKNGTITGISFKYKNTYYKGSKIKRNFSWNNLKTLINYEQDRDHKIIYSNHSGNSRTKSKTKSNTIQNSGFRKEDRQKSVCNLGETERQIKPKKNKTS